jgi:hypothetical protein
LVWGGGGVNGAPRRHSEAAGGAVQRQDPHPKPKEQKPLFVNNHAANILPITHVLVPLVDLLQGVRLGDQLVKLELSGLVETEQLGNIGAR